MAEILHKIYDENDKILCIIERLDNLKYQLSIYDNGKITKRYKGDNPETLLIKHGFIDKKE